MHSRQLSDGLAELARANDQRRDAALLRATTELFVLDATHDRDEIRRYEELATNFLPKVSVADRAFVAERLAACSDAPSSVARMLARDTIEVAAHILRRSPALTPIDLLTVVATTGPEHHRLIAGRQSLPSEVSRALRLKGDPDVMAVLDDGFAVAPPIGTRSIDSSAAARVSPPGRDDPWHFLELDRAARLRIIAAIAAHPPAHDIESADQRLNLAFHTILSAAQIVGFARGGQLASIVAAASDGLRLPADLVAAAINDAGGELLAIMLKALRLDESQARQIFLLASPSGRDVQTFFPLSDLYAGMEPDVAETLVAAWRTAGERRDGGGLQPHLAPNGDRRRSETGATARPGEQSVDQARRA